MPVLTIPMMRSITSDIAYTMDNGAIIKHTLDTTSYLVQTNWDGKAKLQKKAPHYFTIDPDKASAIFIYSIFYTKARSFQYHLSMM